MALSEIEKLERRYAENPNGLTFAPLAEVHRKNGDLPRALELLKPGLLNHPDYIPASIVLGRCHLDLGDLPAAETAFTHVLALDGENVIALKALADINERLHRFDDAERWLTTLLSLDRSNDEARDQLARLELARRQTEVGSAAGAGEAAPLELASEEGGSATGEPMTAIEEPAAAWVSQPDAPSASGPTPLVLEELEPSRLDAFDAPPAGLERDEPVLDQEPIEPMSDLVGREVDLAGPVPDEFRVETSEEIVLESSGGSEFQVPDASQELFSRAAETSPFGEVASPPAPVAVPESAAEPEPEPAVSGGDDSSLLDFGPVLVEAAGMVPPREEEEREGQDEATTESAPTPELEAVAVSEPEPVAAWEPAPEPVEAPPASAVEPPAELLPPEPGGPEPPPPLAPLEPEPVVTETMAEVLLQQGHAAEALGVYRELASRSGDPRLQQRVADLESTRPAPPVVRYSARETGGRSVGDALRAILGARPPARSAAPPVRQAPPGPTTEGAPTRPAAEALSLSSVFGEESPAAPPAVPAAPAERDRVSFDDFYGSSGPAQTPRGPRAAEPKSDDLDEFHTWLQNLKR
jgi:tetratricopeptide (TPR) repeat protein